MAHLNIGERQNAVAKALQGGVVFTGAVMRDYAARFNCSHSAIRADLISLTVKAPVTIHTSHAVRAFILKRDNRVCQYCGRASNGEIVVEHVVPAIAGGPARPYNLVAACQSCNSMKGSEVWIPLNLDAITTSHPLWRQRILSEGVTRLELFSTKEAAKYLGCTAANVKYHVTKGNLTGRVIGRSRVFQQDELDEFIRNRRSVGRPSQATIGEGEQPSA